VSAPETSNVNLGNWRLAPYNRTSFTRVRELIPTANIAASGQSEPLPRAHHDFSRLPVELASGAETTIAAFLEETYTDAWLVVHQGAVLHEWYRNAECSREPHVLFSISKSVTAILAGVLWGDGLLDPDAPVTKYVPELAQSVYGGVTVRHLLDMTVSLQFTEDYLNPDELYLRYRQATGWNPRQPDTETMTGFLARLKKNTHPHGERFHYRSPNSDLLGWVVERAGGRKLAELLSERIWKPMGAEHDAYITLDPAGAARTAGGICMMPADLARFGEMIRCRGVANGRQIVPGAWIDDIRTGGSVDQWVKGDMTSFIPKGRYRSKFYNLVDSSAFMGIGIHGQWLYIDPEADLVIAKFSSQEQPVTDSTDHLHLAAFAALSREFS
jgi:CubicO group peptidase (beta-lactamase class C family)